MRLVSAGLLVALLVMSCGPPNHKNNGEYLGRATGLPEDLKAAMQRLQQAERIEVEPYRTSSARWALSAAERDALKALVKARNAIQFAPGGPSIGIEYWIVIGDEQWGVFGNGVFWYDGTRRLRFAHPDLDFPSPGPREPNSESGRSRHAHIKEGFEKLVELHASGELGD